MAVDTLTVGDVVESVVFHLTNASTSNTALTNEVKKHLGWVLYDIVSKSNLPAFLVEDTLSLVADTSDYALPADFKKVVDPSMHFAASPFEYIQYYEEQDRVLYELKARMTSTSKPIAYTVLGRDDTTGLYSARFIATPDASYTVNFTYFAAPTRINEDTTDGTSVDPRYPREFVSGLILGTALCFPSYLAADQQNIYAQKYRETIVNLRRDQSPIVGNTYQQKRYENRFHDGRDNTWDRTIYTGAPLR